MGECGADVSMREITDALSARSCSHRLSSAPFTFSKQGVESMLSVERMPVYFGSFCIHLGVIPMFIIKVDDLMKGDKGDVPG